MPQGIKKRKRPQFETGPAAYAQLRQDAPGNPDLATAIGATRDAITADLGGADSIPAVRRAAIERLSFLCALLRLWENAISLDPHGPTAAELVPRWTHGVNAMSGLAKLCGTERVKAAADLKTYVAGKRTA
jgi:hypothetical protein